MTAKELREILWNVPDDVIVCCCGEYDNPYDNYYKAEKVVRLQDISHSAFDRICLIGKN